MRVRVPPGALGVRHDVRVLIAAKNFFDGPAAMVFFMLVLAAGYGVCFGLWWFVFRKPRDEDEPRVIAAAGPAPPARPEPPADDLSDGS